MSVDDVLRSYWEGITVSAERRPRNFPGRLLWRYLRRSKPNPRSCQRLTCLVGCNGQLSETGWQKLLPGLRRRTLDLKARKSECHHTV